MDRTLLREAVEVSGRRNGQMKEKLGVTGLPLSIPQYTLDLVH
jgi:hypothetical protein